LACLPVTEPTLPPSRLQDLRLNHYRLLGLHPTAGDQQIRRAYRDRSRRYHPDTTKLAPLVAKQKFQRLNEAYAILSNPERRRLYDLSIGYSRFAVVQPQSPPRQSPPRPTAPTSITEQYERTASAYLDATDRPLSPGELFALFILGVAFVGCLLIAIVVGLNQDALVIQPEFARELGVPISTPHPVLPHNATGEPVRLVVPGN
jgi:DnaJ domain